MALIANAAIEVRPTNGSDINGGGFTPCIGSKTVSAATDLTIDATTNTKVTSATHNFVSGDNGKYLVVTAGTGWIVGIFRIVSTAANAATLDRSPVTSIAAATGHSGTYDLYDGIDYSQQNSPQVVIDNSAITTSITTTVVTFTGSTHATTANENGNYVHFASGTNITAGWWRITAVSVAANNGTWTMDANVPSSGTTTNAVGKMGGALQTITQAIATAIGSNKIFVKAEAAITITASTAVNAAGVTPGSGVPCTQLIGYTSTRNDGGQVTITVSTNTGISAFNISVSGWEVKNFAINCASLGTSTGILVAANYCNIRNNKISAFTSWGIRINGGTGITVLGNEITTGTSAATAGIEDNNSSNVIAYNNVHDNACSGISTLATGHAIVGNLITNNTGASSQGIKSNSFENFIVANTVSGSGQDGCNLSSTNNNVGLVLKNNIFANNTRYGCNFSGGSVYPADFRWDGNAYYNNTTANRNGMDDISTATAVDGIWPYVNTLDVVCTADPFTNSAGGDFTLNATAGGGAAIRGHGTPASYPGATGTNNVDMGTFQHADPASGATASALVP